MLEVGVARQPRDHGRGGGDVRGLRKIFSGTENIWSRRHLYTRGPQRRVLADDHGAGRVPRGAAVDGDRADADAVRLRGEEVIRGHYEVFKQATLVLSTPSTRARVLSEALTVVLRKPST